jgi:hypothetical protein
MKPSDMAPAACIVCGKKHPGGDNVPGWTYFSGVQPLGAMSCSLPCAEAVILRVRKTGRADVPKEQRGPCRGCGLMIVIDSAKRTVSHQAPLCEQFKAMTAGKQVEQSLELRDERGDLVPMQGKGEA